MKIKNWIFGIALMTATASLWAADGPSENLQKGLFEEEANHNLEAAIKAYQAVIQQTDEQRKLGATAIFRVGECYRKLGRTNDAVTQYRRLLREFPDQEKLVQASQQLEAELSGGPKHADEPYKNVAEFNSSPEAKELQRIKGLVKDSPDLVNSRSSPNSNGGTLLHTAASSGWMTVAEFLLANQAEVNAPDRTKKTPLHSAATAGHKSMVELLLAHGADVNAADTSGRTPLHEASLHGYKTVVESLLAGKANVNALGNYGWTPLHSAARNGHRAIAAVLVKSKADLNAHTTGVVTESGMSYRVGVTPLIVATISDFVGFGELLCEAGAQVDDRDEERETALHYAVGNDAVKSVAVLLRFHANANTENAYHYSPLHKAVIAKNKESVEALLAAGAKPNSSADDGSYPLWSAVDLGRVDLAEALLKGSADPNATNRYTRTVLHLAVENVNEPMAELLLNYKANPNSQDQSGWTSLHKLTWKFRNNAPPNNDGSWHRRCVGIFKLLLSHKADVNLRNSEGLAPLNLFGVPAKASKVADEEVMALLKEHGAIDDLPELAARPSLIRVWRKGLATGRDVFSKDSAGRNRFTVLEALWSFYSASQLGGRAAFRPANQGQDPSFDFPDLARIKIRRLADGKTYRPIEVNLLKGPEDQPEIDCSKNVELEYGDVIEIPEREHALGEPPTGLEATFRAQMQGCVTHQVKLITKGALIVLSLDPGSNRYLSSVLNKSEALRVIVSSADFSRVKVTRHDAKSGESETLNVNLLEIRRGAKRGSEDLLLRDGDEIEVPEK